MITTILCGVLMFLVTLAIQFTLFKFKKNPNWWHNSCLLIVIAAIGLWNQDPDFFAILIGHIAAFETSKLVGWHE